MEASYPATLPFDLAAAQRGWRLNAFGRAMRDPVARAACTADPAGFLATADLSAEERAALLAKDWKGLMDMGASIYALAKLGPVFGTPLPVIMASMR